MYRDIYIFISIYIGFNRVEGNRAVYYIVVDFKIAYIYIEMDSMVNVTLFICFVYCNMMMYTILNMPIIKL